MNTPVSLSDIAEWHKTGRLRQELAALDHRQIADISYRLREEYEYYERHVCENPSPSRMMVDWRRQHLAHIRAIREGFILAKSEI